MNAIRRLLQAWKDYRTGVRTRGASIHYWQRQAALRGACCPDHLISGEDS